MAVIEYGYGICRDTSVLGDNVYVDEQGQGCGTVWYPTVAQARKIVKLYEGTPEGHHANVCHLCKCRYSFGSDEHRKAPFEYACKEWKAKVAAGDIETINKAKRERLKKRLVVLKGEV